MVDIRKATAGQIAGRNPDRSVWTYTWDEPGAVVDVANEYVPELLAIPHHDFAVVEPEPNAAGANDEQNSRQIEEPAPPAEMSEAPTPRKRPARKTPATGSAGSNVEE